MNLGSKTYGDTYLYKQYSEYEKKMYAFILNAERVNTKGKEFEDILFDIKRRKISDSLAKIITSDNVVLGIYDGNTMPKAFKAFAARDVKEDKNKVKVFIDVTGCVDFKDGVYVCRNMEWLISYVINAMVAFIYNAAPMKLVGNSSIIVDGGVAFMKLYSYIIDRLYKTSTVQQIRLRVEYLASLYYQINILGRDFNKSYDSIVANAIKISNIDKRDAGVVNALFDKEDFTNIDTFVRSFSKIGFKDIKTSVVVDLWMKAFGTGTIFALEFFPSFSAMLTNTYVGGYLDQQLTIEKLTNQDMVSFTKTILQIGASVT